MRYMRMRKARVSRSSATAYGTFLFVNVLLALWRIRRSATSRSQYDWHDPLSDSSTGYYYTPSTLPMHLPLPPTAPVALTLHETHRFGMNPNDTSGDTDWETMLHLSDGYGRAWLPVGSPNDRQYFVVSYFHQLHCLRALQRALVAPHRTDSVAGSPMHVEHCLNYLRQTMLCGAADTLEKGDFMAEEPGMREGVVRGELVCRDWEAVIGTMQRNYEEFVQWNVHWNGEAI